LLLTNFQSALGASAFPNATVSAQDALTLSLGSPKDIREQSFTRGRS